MPKNESVVEMAIIKVALIAPSRKSGMVIAGRIWRVIIYIFGAPAMITPSRYGFSQPSIYGELPRLPGKYGNKNDPNGNGNSRCMGIKQRHGG